MPILLAINKKEVREMLAFAVESRAEEKVYEASTAKEAIDALADHGAIRTVICEYPGISDVLFRHLVSLNRARPERDQIRTIVCSARKPEGDETVKRMNVLGYASWGNLIDSTLALLGGAVPENVETPESDKALTDADTCRIRTALLIRVGLLQAGVYVRLSPTKYVKLFQEGDEFEKDDYTRILNEKRLDYLYLRRDECSEFLLKFKQDLLALLQDDMAVAAAVPKLLEEVHETAQELLNKLGATAEVQAVVKANVQIAVKAMGKAPKLADILKRFEIDREKYIASHSMLIPQIAGALAMTMDWKSETTLQKLALASFLHDVPLTNQALAAVTSLTEFARKKDEFSEEEAKAYKFHPVKASELAKQFQEIPPDVDTIILQHHERPDGSGFPRGMTQHQISPLAAVFIVAHDLVSAMFDPATPFVLAQFVEATKEKYASGNFRKLHAQLATLKL
ncbi:MAG: hypothetical protein JST04_09095 [Bdellovibrionales bacterium]|nr:hypothetical protein [Bdellovibrionales bacterium]